MMALLWFDGFDHYGLDTARMLEGPYNQVDAAFTLSEVNPRTGARCLRRSSQSSDSKVVKKLPAGHGTLGVGIAVHLSQLPSNSYTFSTISFLNENDEDEFIVIVNMDGSIGIVLLVQLGREIAFSNAGLGYCGGYFHIEVASKANELEDVFRNSFIVN
jgi:hypothetical protein